MARVVATRSLVGAFRFAFPGSGWAIRRYDGDKMARAQGQVWPRLRHRSEIATICLAGRANSRLWAVAKEPAGR